MSTQTPPANLQVAEISALFSDALPTARILTTAIDDYSHDEGLGLTPQAPVAVLLPETVEEVSAIVQICDQHKLALTARGSGTGLSGAAIPNAGGVVVSFERMKSIEIDIENQMAVVGPGVTLAELDEVLAPLQLVYPVQPGENSSSLGGNVATNAGGMRAVKYGVTRHQVLGLEVVLTSGEVIRTGGKFVKGSTGYDLTQLIIGSEGTLALVTEVIIKLHPRLAHEATILAPFRSLDEVMHAVPRLVASGLGPMIVEYINVGLMDALSERHKLSLGVPADVKAQTEAYLVMVMENSAEVRLDEDVAALAEMTSGFGALDVYVLPKGAGEALIRAREQAFWLSKDTNAGDLVDIVVPRGSMPEFFDLVSKIAAEEEAFITGCGHAGDGNVHLSVYPNNPENMPRVMMRLFETGMSLGGVISGEHGLGTAKRKYFLELEDPVKIALMRRIKAAFDPNGILNPDKVI